MGSKRRYMMNKKEKFKQAIEEFRNSKQTTEDYLKFISISEQVLRQGDGLTWTSIKEILEEVLTRF
jgi:hypothetical protein